MEQWYYLPLLCFLWGWPKQRGELQAINPPFWWTLHNNQSSFSVENNILFNPTTNTSIEAHTTNQGLESHNSASRTEHRALKSVTFPINQFFIRNLYLQLKVTSFRINSIYLLLQQYKLFTTVPDLRSEIQTFCFLILSLSLLKDQLLLFESQP